MKLSVLLIACQLLAVSFAHNPLYHCYDANGDSKYCIPAPLSNGRNIVAGRPPTATSTCGQEKQEQVCTRSGAVGDYAGACKACDSSELSAEFITDTEEADNITYWQSQTYSLVRYPSSVNLTFDLGNKAYSVQEIKIVFQSSRPESFALLASADYEETYKPIHYFSRSCLDTYGISEGVGGSEEPGCSSDEAQLLPLTGGTVSFSATERTGSPVVATHIMIRLDRHNTFGDEHSSEQAILDSYYYAISNVVITGQCFCNGHASSCSEDDSGQWRCDCTHGTTGPDCDMCMPLFNDLPWRPATLEQAAECKECNCNGRASQCAFNETVFNQSGSVSGGVCDCQFNTSGKNCEVCSMDVQDPPCSPCGCSGGETENTMCNQSSGKCVCIDGFNGSSCDVCRSTYYRREGQCIPCGCNPHGSLTNTCNDVTGQCSCKDGVTSRDCSMCALGFHRVEDGCPACHHCYDDLLFEYHSAASLLEELTRAINTSLNGSMVDSSLLEVIADLNILLQDLASKVSNLSEREMNLKTNIQGVTDDVAASEAVINVFHSQIVEYENASNSAKEQIMDSRTAASHVSEVVEEIDIKLTHALGNLTAARELFSQIEEQLAILVDTADEAKVASLDQERTVDQILRETMKALNDSIQAHSEMCSVLKEENKTLSDLRSLVKNNITELDHLHGETEEEISQAVTSASASLSESERLESEVDDLFVPIYDPDALITQASLIHSSASSVIGESTALLTSIEVYRQDFTALNSTAHELLELATILNDTALDLSTRAHAARALGTTSVSDAEKVINQTEYLLLELNKQLAKFKEIALNLEKLIEMIQKAEDVSSEAESEALHQKELLAQASQTAGHAMQVLLNAAINIQFAAENATMALDHAEASDSNVQTLKTDVERLSTETDKENENVAALEERADRDSEALDKADKVAGYAKSNVTATEATIVTVEAKLDKINEELRSLELISQEKFNDFVTRLESIKGTLDATDDSLEKTQREMDQVEDGLTTLQEDYATLLQHRDLLKDILENLQQLDCVEMTIPV